MRELRKLLPKSPIALTFWWMSLAAALLIALFNPFGLNTRTETSLQASFDRLTEYLYPDGEAHNIALIVPTYDEVKSGSEQQPIAYARLADIVDLARQARARAVYLDYEFAQKPGPADNPDDLADAVDQAAREGVVVFGGPIAPERPEFARLRPLIHQLDLDQFGAHPTDYMLASGHALAPAAALAIALCSGPNPLPAHDCKRGLVQALSGGGSIPPLVMQLGTTSAPEQAAYTGKAEAERCEPQPWRGVLAAALNGQSPGRPCDKFLTIPADFAASDISPDFRRRMIDDLHGRAIIVGPGGRLGDDHLWPGFGFLPGAVFHAAALDNLLAEGPDYRRWPPTSPGLHIGLDSLIQIGLIFATPLIVQWFAGLLRHEPAKPSEGKEKPQEKEKRPLCPMGKAILALLLLGAAILVPAVVAALFFLRAFWPPASALLVVGVGVPLMTVLCSEELVAALRPLNTPRMAGVMLAAVGGAIVWVALPPNAAPSWCAALLLAIVLFNIPSVAARLQARTNRWLTSVHKEKAAQTRSAPPGDAP